MIRFVGNIYHYAYTLPSTKQCVQYRREGHCKHRLNTGSQQRRRGRDILHIAGNKFIAGSTCVGNNACLLAILGDNDTVGAR